MKYIEKLSKIKGFNEKINLSIENVYNKIYSLTEGYRKDAGKLVRDIIFGFIKIKDISLSEISRESGKIKKGTKKKNIVAGYSKFLKNTKLIKNYMKKYIHKVTKILGKGGKIVYVAIDGGDIIKPHSNNKDIKYIRDGSTGKMGKGYPMETALAFNKDLESVPLIGKIFTRKRKYKSDNKEYFDILKILVKSISKFINICFIFDRGYDDKKMFELVSSMGKKFIVAMKKSRYVKIKGKTIWIENAYTKLKSLKENIKITLKSGREIEGKLYYGMVRMFESNGKRKYWLVVVKNNKGTFMLLTNNEIKNKEQAKETIKAYSYRRLIEETYKYLKQEYKLEKIHLRSGVERMNNFYNLLLSAIGLGMLGLNYLGNMSRELIIELRKDHYLGYKLKNILYAWLEILEYFFKQGKLFGNRYRRKKLFYKQNSLFSQY